MGPDRLVYLDHALRGPPPARARAAVARAVEASARGSLDRTRQAAAIAATRARLGRLLGWPAPCVSFTLNTTTAIATFAQSVPWCDGDRVLVHQDEEPSNILPWRALEGRGVRVEVLPSRGGRLELADLELALNRGGVRVVALAAVALETGERRDLAAIGRLARAAGALLCVDAAQALGALQLDLSHVSAVCGCARKWLLGPPDVGILALRPGLSEGLVVPTAGGCSGAAEALRFEGGALPALVIEGLGASGSLLEEVGLPAIEARVLELSSAVREAAARAGRPVRSPQGPAASGVVWVGLGAPQPGLEARLAAEGIVVRVVGDRMRISGHYWNSDDDVAALFQALARVSP